MTAWKSWCESKAFITTIFEKYDKNGDGMFQKEELMDLLTELNGGKDVKVEDVTRIMAEADKNG